MKLVILSLLFTFLLALTTGCGGSPKSTPAPTQPPTTARVPATNAPATQARPPATSPASQSGAQALAAAMAKTLGATVFKGQEDFAGSPAILPTFAESTTDSTVTEFHTDGKFSGSNYNVRIQGLMAGVFGADVSKGFEVSKVDGKTFVRGPAPVLDAPDGKWYQLDSAGGTTLTISPLDTLAKVARAGGDWSAFTKTRTGDSLDSLSCDLYSAGKDAAAAVFQAMLNGMMSSDQLPVVDEGAISLYVCSDGNVHTYVADFTAHSPVDPAKKGKARLGLDLRSFDETFSIDAPLGAVVIAGPTAAPTPAALPATPTARPVVVNPNAGYDGDWEGTSSADSPVSFTVQDNQITEVSLNYSVTVNGCTVSGSIYKAVDEVPAGAQPFTIEIVQSNEIELTFSGSFSSNSQASGKIQVKGTSKVCGPVNASQTWNAGILLATPEPTGESLETLPVVVPA